MQEEGSFGLLTVHWLDRRAGLRATTVEDPVHRKFNDMKDFIVHASCWIRILEH